MEKPENVLRSMTTDRQTAFKIKICNKASTCINKRKPPFLTLC